jgi:predicted DNA-binding transcriptional regulator YafY
LPQQELFVDKELIKIVKLKCCGIKAQEVINVEEHMLQITVRPNKDLEAQIFSYGPQVEVLEPLWLRQQIEEKIVETLNKYSSRKKDCTDDK